MSDHIDLRVLLVCADLLTACEQLGHRRKNGQPKILADVGAEDPGALLLAVCDTVQPDDLPGGWKPLWAACVAMWRDGRDPTLQEAVETTPLKVRAEARSACRFALEHGCGVGLMAPGSAEKVLRWAEANRKLQAARQEMAEAALESKEAFRGVL